MNLKNKVLTVLFFFSSALAFGSCSKEIDEELVSNLWKETARIHSLKTGTPMPQIYYLEQDYFSQYVSKECYKGKNSKSYPCREISEQTMSDIGYEADYLYRNHVYFYENLKNADCKRGTPEEKAACEKDLKDLGSDLNALGRAFLAQNRIEIYTSKIHNSVYNHYAAYLSNNEIEMVFYGIAAHEMAHIALYRNGCVLGKWHHALMYEFGYLDKAADYLSNYYGLEKENDAKSVLINNLRYGVELDEIRNRILERQNKKSGD